MKQERDLLIERAEWSIPAQVRSKDIICCKIDGETVEGEVCISFKDISVKLLGSEPELKDGLHIMAMAPFGYTVENKTDSYANKKGIRTIKELLIDLYLRERYTCLH